MKRLLLPFKVRYVLHLAISCAGMCKYSTVFMELSSALRLTVKNKLI